MTRIPSRHSHIETEIYTCQARTVKFGCFKLKGPSYQKSGHEGTPKPDPDAFLSLAPFIRESDLFLASIPVIVQQNVDTIGRRKSRGKSAELELVHLLEKYGYGARRSAASGVGGWVSDVEATKEGIWLAIEVKSSRRAYAIIPGHQMEKIRQDLAFAGKLGIPTLGICAAKFPHCEPPWCFYRLMPEDYQKPFIKIRRGQASNWTPVQSEQQLTSEDPFSLESPQSLIFSSSHGKTGVEHSHCEVPQMRTNSPPTDGVQTRVPRQNLYLLEILAQKRRLLHIESKGRARPLGFEGQRSRAV